jgi:tetratricopeptide (TPR) repeat protein
MRNSFILLLIVAWILLPSSRLQAQDLRDPRFMERAQAGFTDIYNFDYAQARQVFASLEREYPQHPAPPLYQACILWLEEMLRRQDLSLNRFVYPSYFSVKTKQEIPPQDRDAFFRHIQKCEALADAILKKNSHDKDARYFLGTSYGLRSSFAITIDHSLRSAYSNGTKAYELTRQLTQEDPDYYDAYLTVGIYEYVVGSIPWYLKWMAFMVGARGDKEKGLEHLRLAAEKGQYVKNEALLVQMVLNVREQRYAQALQIAQDLSRRFPRNFLFALSEPQISRLAGQKDQAVAMLLQVEKRVEAREPNFGQIPLRVFRYDLGRELMDMGRLDLAQERFLKAIGDPQTPARERALSHLKLGRILEWRGKKNEAVKEYQTVLSLADVENSHNQARQYLARLNRN